MSVGLSKMVFFGLDSRCMLVVVCISLGLSGCGTPPTSTTTTTTSTVTTTTTTTTTTLWSGEGQSIWAWREDVDWFKQTTSDYSGDPVKSTLQGCWGGGGGTPGGVEQVGIENVERGITYAKYQGETGITLYNGLNQSMKQQNKKGCFMRKSRVPVDLSQIGKIELDIKTSGSGPNSPWWAFWLEPVVYPIGNMEGSAEIDVIENYDYKKTRLHQDGSKVKTQFSQCDPDLHPQDAQWCTSTHWNVDSTKIDHHVEVSAQDRPGQGRVIEVKHCDRNNRCGSARMFATKPGLPSSFFPVWKKASAGDMYGHYWMVLDIWYTSGTDFSLDISNVKFHKDDGSEWKMPLKGDPPPLKSPVLLRHGNASVLDVEEEEGEKEQEGGFEVII
mmetsp:Transcript_118822/g.236720  ORF Transcript_118822/g.236720 Transcript_118822/m.236720 type:complete len:387 (-) Transcript_118822:273-1433(-)|eukprot:CAMPEP_0172722416 /NCGR_PEP_ID=MMETSP1074-20121228/81405_1 /TAXON_ID=2916 /ORGANISM="Ceratium fusus, Strain PA161109" /LENGTH=386 /DNA_ID=CAMNT_0013548421 /DNA_START=48 /DNA_END=1208 /DNA_ORIENTATION=+